MSSETGVPNSFLRALHFVPEVDYACKTDDRVHVGTGVLRPCTGNYIRVSAAEQYYP